MHADIEQIVRSTVPGRIVVIGAGAVGIYAAAQLADRGHEVVLLEAGQPSLGNFDGDSYASIGRPHSGIRIGRSRAVGGTTNLWGGQLVEFQPIDFEGRSWLPGSRWPFPTMSLPRTISPRTEISAFLRISFRMKISGRASRPPLRTSVQTSKSSSPAG